jgi:hypothetical protein
LQAAYHDYLQYLRALDEAWLPASVRQAQQIASQTWQEAMQQAWAPDEMQQRFERAYQTYLELTRALQGWSEDDRSRIAELQHAYEQAVRDAYVPPQVIESSRDACEKYQQAVIDASTPEAMQQRFEAAYHAYLTCLQAVNDMYGP